MAPKLVQKIQMCEYVIMSELLPDNLELARHAAETQRGSSGSPKSQSDLMEDLKGLVAWSVSFSAFVAIVAETPLEVSTSLLRHHSDGSSSLLVARAG